MSYFVVDVESDGQIIGKNGMVCFGAVKLTPALDTTFYGKVKPISFNYDPKALAVSGISREEHEEFDDPKEVMEAFALWLRENSVGRPVLISDNNGYDASWINYYFHVYYGTNPFGWSSRRIGDLYCGVVKDTWATWKHLRVTKHTHNLSDVINDNTKILQKMKEMKLKINTK